MLQGGGRPVKAQCLEEAGEGCSTEPGTGNLVRTVPEGTGESIPAAQEAQSLAYQHVPFPGSRGGGFISIFLHCVLWIPISPYIQRQEEWIKNFVSPSA